MNTILKILLVPATIAALVGCGNDGHNRRAGALKMLNEVLTQTFTGVDERGEPCTISLTRDDSDRPTRITYEATYQVDYKIPTPASGLSGLYYWPKKFDSAVNFSAKELTIRSGFGQQTEKIEGEGKGLFWDDILKHQITARPNFREPVSISYYCVQNVLGVIPMVKITHECHITRT